MDFFFRKYLCISWELLSEFLVEPIPDLSRLNPCGVYPWLIFHVWKWRYPIPRPVLSDPLLIRITSSGIKALTLDTGSILSDIFFLRILMSHSPFMFCSIIWVLVYFVCDFCMFIFHLWVYSILFSVLFFCFRFSFSFSFFRFLSILFDFVSLFACSMVCLCLVLFEFCLGRILFAGWIWGLGQIAYRMNILVGLVELIEHSIILDELWRAHNIKKKRKEKKSSCKKKFEKNWVFNLWMRIWIS